MVTGYTVQWKWDAKYVDLSVLRLMEVSSGWYVWNGVHVLGTWGDGRYAEVKSLGGATVWLPSGAVHSPANFSDIDDAKRWAQYIIADHYEPDWFGSGTATGTSYTMTGLPDGRAYAVRVKAHSPNGSSPWSGVASATTAALPDAPGALQLSADGSNLTVSWGAPGDNGSAIVAYSVHWLKVEGPGSLEAGERWVTGGTSTTVTGLTIGGEYAVRVKAINVVGVSASEISYITLN